jgi:hypothetical protein
MSIRDIIGSTMGGGQVGWDGVGRYLAANYIENKLEVQRIADAKKRDEYFDGGGEMGILRIIEVAFTDDLTKKLRADLVSWAKWNNVIRRVATELATVYSEPAERKVTDGNDSYQDFLDAIGADLIMREVDEKLVYHEDVWIQYRVRRETSEPILDVVSPAKFWAVHHPADITQLVAVIIDQCRSDSETAARYRVWTDSETFQMDGAKRVMSETVTEHSFGRIPGVLASVRPASAKGRLLTQSPAADLVAAHEAIWFIGVLLLKETKSANNQTYVTGDTSTAALGQSADTEREAILPEGVTVQSIDRGMNLEQFMKIADHVLERAAANRGLPPTVLHQQGAASGAEVHLRRIPIRELRKKRIPIMRRVERQILEVEYLVNRAELPVYVFLPTGFAIDFGEVQQPMTAAEDLAVFETERRLGLTSTLKKIMARNPDLTIEQALAELKENNKQETDRVRDQKELMALNGSTQTAPDEQTAAENGKDGESESPSRFGGRS